MNATERIKEEYVKQARKRLHEYPDVLRLFEGLWQAGKFREAYLKVDEAVRTLGIIVSPEQRKVDEDFYWDVVN